MVCIIAGSRFATKAEVYDAIAQSGVADQITVVVSGKCSQGGDLYGEEWADEHAIPVVPFPADWNNLNVPGAVVKVRNGKPYNARAGFDRNEQMAKYAAEHNGCLIALLKGESNGTMDMIKRAKRHKLVCYIFRVEFV